MDEQFEAIQNNHKFKFKVEYDLTAGTFSYELTNTVTNKVYMSNGNTTVSMSGIQPLEWDPTNTNPIKLFAYAEDYGTTMHSTLYADMVEFSNIKAYRTENSMNPTSLTRLDGPEQDQIVYRNNHLQNEFNIVVTDSPITTSSINTFFMNSSYQTHYVNIVGDYYFTHQLSNVFNQTLDSSSTQFDHRNSNYVYVYSNSYHANVLINEYIIPAHEATLKEEGPFIAVTNFTNLSTNFPIGNSDRTIMAWITLNSTGYTSDPELGRYTIVHLGLAGQTNQAFALQVRYDRLGLMGWGNDYWDVSSAYVLNDFKEHFVAVTWNSATNTATGYVDGQVAWTAIMTDFDTPSSGDVMIGQSINDSTFNFGSIRDVTIYNMTLNDAQIQNTYDTEYVAPMELLVHVSWDKDTSATRETVAPFKLLSMKNLADGTDMNIHNYVPQGSETISLHTQEVTINGIRKGLLFNYSGVSIDVAGTYNTSFYNTTPFGATSIAVFNNNNPNLRNVSWNKFSTIGYHGGFFGISRFGGYDRIAIQFAGTTMGGAGEYIDFSFGDKSNSWNYIVFASVKLISTDLYEFKLEVYRFTDAVSGLTTVASLTFNRSFTLTTQPSLNYKTYHSAIDHAGNQALTDFASLQLFETRFYKGCMEETDKNILLTQLLNYWGVAP
jgi:hypothetical protein